MLDRMNKEIVDVLEMSMRAMQRVRAQVRGVLPEQDIDEAIAACKTLLLKHKEASNA